jgi:glycerol kinase
MRSYVLAIDQGTTSSRAIVFDDKLHAVAVAQEEFTQHFPRPGFVEHDAEEIWATVLSTSRNAIAKAGISAAAIAAIGITNQRETTLIWERDTGRPIHRAIVWQDRRTADRCQTLKSAGYEPGITAKTPISPAPKRPGCSTWSLAPGNARHAANCASARSTAS